MRRPFRVEPLDPPSPKRWWAAEIAQLTDEEVASRSLSRGHLPADEVVPGEVFLRNAMGLGVPVGQLYRALYAQWTARSGHSIPFDACTWPQALEYAGKALPSGTEAQRYEWAIRYMWCLEIEEPPLPSEAVLARALTGEASMPKASPSEPQQHTAQATSLAQRR